VRSTPFLVELRNIPFEQQRQVLFYIVDRLPRFRAGKLDSRGNGQYLAEVAMQRYGSARIEQVMLTAEWYRANMPPYKAAWEDAMILAPRDSQVLDDHRALRVVNGIPRIPERSTNDKGAQQRHGDSAIAGCMMYAASNADPIEYGYDAAPKSTHRTDEGGADDDGYVFGGGRPEPTSMGGSRQGGAF
jgi:phage FluMu gp28-like protein